eukprot:670563-Amorphochlora_amoeboformis.AAC.1
MAGTQATPEPTEPMSSGGEKKNRTTVQGQQPNLEYYNTAVLGMIATRVLLVGVEQDYRTSGQLQ